MSKAQIAFNISIKDAEDLLAHFDALPKPPQGNIAEVLKRAGLVMALTAWETYVEDRLREAVTPHLRVVDGSHVGNFMLRQLESELRRFNNPTTDKTRKLFQDYLDIDVTTDWEWQHFDRARVKKTLDELMSKRGDAVHRSKPTTNGGPPAAHLVKRDDLDKAIRFLKSLVVATDRALSYHSH